MKLNNPNTSAKTYWSILKSFYNDSKVPLISPLLVNNKIVSDFTKKANIFNDFFALQRTPLNNSSVLPVKVTFKTHSRFNSIGFEEDDILKIIRNLHIDKAHGHDNISIRMLKICDSVVVEPLSLIFKNCIDSGIFPNLWKKSHIKMINVVSTTIGLFLYYQFVEKYLSALFIILYIYTSKTMTCLTHINLVFVLTTFVYINCP